ncbi:Cupin domain-containing protein [Franzmannia pantelleriensis]|uniref:Cupin domain-containing protein n=2 Tax=Franzmannia pantelleriensis TaxID=48727 RepID=A0A1G9IBQ3_9GAMM|nr:Cupin domain-containing protein [Halomonas pantelleriensis]
MNSLGLASDPHVYWQFYQPSSLMLNNYFHFITRNKRFFFKYIGALFYTEASLANISKEQAILVKDVFGNGVDTQYFDEHYHIDEHHGEMVLFRIIQPLLEQYGNQIVNDILLGFEEFQLLQRLADEDILIQLEWADNLDTYRDKGDELFHKLPADVDLDTFDEALGERSTTHTHPDHRLLYIERGEMDFWSLVGDPVKLKEKDVLLIPKHRLHGSVVRSSSCLYHQPIIESML